MAIYDVTNDVAGGGAFSNRRVSDQELVVFSDDVDHEEAITGGVKGSSPFPSSSPSPPFLPPEFPDEHEYSKFLALDKKTSWINASDPYRKYKVFCALEQDVDPLGPLAWCIALTFVFLVVALFIHVTLTRLQSLRDSYSRLEQMKDEMAIAKTEAEAASKAKGAFLAAVSHEIRTPLNGILGMLALLRKTPLDATQADYADTASESGRALCALVNDVLDFSKIEAGMMVVERIPFSLRDEIDSVLSIFSEKSREKGIELWAYLGEGVPEVLCGDPLRIRQVLINLIGNSLKFTESGHIFVCIRVARDGEDVSPRHCAEKQDDKQQKDKKQDDKPESDNEEPNFRSSSKSSFSLPRAGWRLSGASGEKTRGTLQLASLEEVNEEEGRELERGQGGRKSGVVELSEKSNADNEGAADSRSSRKARKEMGSGSAGKEAGEIHSHSICAQNPSSSTASPTSKPDHSSLSLSAVSSSFSASSSSSFATLSGKPTMSSCNSWHRIQDVIHWSKRNPHFRYDPDSHVRLICSVEDTGVGIPLESQDKLFQPFVQADASTTRTHGGTGIGLCISQRLVQLMGGNMNFLSLPGVGTTFLFSLSLSVGSMQQFEKTGNQSMYTFALENATASLRGVHVLYFNGVKLSKKRKNALKHAGIPSWEILREKGSKDETEEGKIDDVEGCTDDDVALTWDIGSSIRAAVVESYLNRIGMKLLEFSEEVTGEGENERGEGVRRREGMAKGTGGAGENEGEARERAYHMESELETDQDGEFTSDQDDELFDEELVSKDVSKWLFSRNQFWKYERISQVRILSGRHLAPHTRAKSLELLNTPLYNGEVVGITTDTKGSLYSIEANDDEKYGSGGTGNSSENSPMEEGVKRALSPRSNSAREAAASRRSARLFPSLTPDPANHQRSSNSDRYDVTRGARSGGVVRSAEEGASASGRSHGAGGLVASKRGKEDWKEGLTKLLTMGRPAPKIAAKDSSKNSQGIGMKGGMSERREGGKLRPRAAKSESFASPEATMAATISDGFSRSLSCAAEKTVEPTSVFSIFERRRSFGGGSNSDVRNESAPKEVRKGVFNKEKWDNAPANGGAKDWLQRIDSRTREGKGKKRDEEEEEEEEEGRKSDAGVKQSVMDNDEGGSPRLETAEGARIGVHFSSRQRCRRVIPKEVNALFLAMQNSRIIVMAEAKTLKSSKISPLKFAEKMQKTLSETCARFKEATEGRENSEQVTENAKLREGSLIFPVVVVCDNPEEAEALEKAKLFSSTAEDFLLPGGFTVSDFLFPICKPLRKNALASLLLNSLSTISKMKEQKEIESYSHGVCGSPALHRELEKVKPPKYPCSGPLGESKGDSLSPEDGPSSPSRPSCTSRGSGSISGRSPSNAFRISLSPDKHAANRSRLGSSPRSQTENDKNTKLAGTRGAGRRPGGGRGERERKDAPQSSSSRTAFGVGSVSRRLERSVSGILKQSMMGCRICVVDDNAVNRKVISKTLSQYGCVVETLASGIEAVKKLEPPHEYQIILMDIQMPGMDGYQATERIRKMEMRYNNEQRGSGVKSSSSLPSLQTTSSDASTYPSGLHPASTSHSSVESVNAASESASSPPLFRVPIIALTADVLLETKQRCVEVGMDEFMTKPISEDQLYKVLPRFIHKMVN